MEEDHPTRTRPLTDWIILVFVLVVMGLLMADLGSNVMGELDREGPVVDSATSDRSEVP